MKRSTNNLHHFPLLATVLAASILASWLSGVACAADSDAPLQWTPSLMLEVKRIGSVQVSPDGTRAAFTVRQAVLAEDRSEFVTHIHLAAVQGGQSRQLTQGEKSCDDPQWSPDGEWIAFVSSRGGKKNLWLIRPDGGEAVQLTDGKTDVTSFRWSPDGRSLAFVALDPPTPDEERQDREKDDAKVVDENVKLNQLFLIPVAEPPTMQRQPRLLTPGH